MGDLEKIQAAIYKARWVDSFGKDGKLGTDKEIAEAVLAALQEG